MLPSVASLILAATAMAAAVESRPSSRKYGCGEVDIVFTGLPGEHPLVYSQGYNGTEVQAGIEQDSKNTIAAGYNLKTLLMGPERSMTEFEQHVGGHIWNGVGLGYGVRGSHFQNLTIRAEDILNYYHQIAPWAPIAFDLNFTTALWAIERHFPLAEDCTDKPGKDLGFEILCDICEH